MKYFINHNFLFNQKGICSCGILKYLDALNNNSCNAPNGQSHPQKTPLPRNNSDKKVYIAIIVRSGSYKN